MSNGGNLVEIANSANNEGSLVKITNGASNERRAFAIVKLNEGCQQRRVLIGKIRKCE